MTQHLRIRFHLAWLALLLWPSVPLATAHAAGRAADSVAKWHRWELELHSSVSYSNPIEQAELQVVLISPLGETNRVEGFWDGGSVWKARFKPSFPGTWQYHTLCSDTTNPGLHGQTGTFLCSAPTDETDFTRHGPIQVARDQQHLEHADHTPFFWLGDAAWSAAGRASLEEWRAYLQTRRQQKFNVTLWRLPAAIGSEQTPLYRAETGFAINPDAFREVEQNVIAANQANVLNAIAPLWEIGLRPGAELPEAHAIALLRYALARWNAADVVWIIAFDCDSSGVAANRWKKICRQVFDAGNHAPVILVPGESFWVYDGFRSEPWADGFGFQTSSVTDANSLPWLLGGAPSQERWKVPPHPLLSILPPPTSQTPVAGKTITTEFARRLLWWNALLITPAGVTYAAQPIAEWHTDSGAGPTWREALASTDAQAFVALSETMAATDFWTWQPSPTPLLATLDPATLPVYPLIVTNRTGALVYLPEGRAIHLAAKVLPPGARATWRDLRANQTQPAQAASVPGSNRLEMRPPAPGDWLLEIKAPTTATDTTRQQNPK